MKPDNHIAYQPHNHALCIQSALETAEKMCSERGARLTSLRQQVLRLIWESHKPLGAYDLMDMLAANSNKRVAPPTVYRTLEFLQKQCLVHRLASLNAYIGCCSPQTDHQSYFFICRHCNITMELSHKSVHRAIHKAANQLAFEIENETLEVVGLCPNCRPKYPESSPS